MVQVPMGRSWVSICGFARGVTPSAQNVMTSHVMTGSSERTKAFAQHPRGLTRVGGAAAHMEGHAHHIQVQVLSLPQQPCRVAASFSRQLTAVCVEDALASRDLLHKCLVLLSANSHRRPWQACTASISSVGQLQTRGRAQLAGW